MDDIEKYLRSLLKQQGIAINDRIEQTFRMFASSEENCKNVKTIRLLQEQMTKSWQLIARREEINSMQIAFPNGIAGKPYKAEFNFTVYGLDDIKSYSLIGFEGSGLQYDPTTKIIQGLPENNGDITLTFSFNFEGEPEEAEPNSRKVTIIINPDPKSLWKDIPSDASDSYAKSDNTSETASFLGKTLIVASKRGRSHANKGSFRDDDYAFAELESGWGIIAVSDGAGSAIYSRKGSQLACKSAIDYFSENFTGQTKLLDEAITAYTNGKYDKSKVLDIAHPHLLLAAKKASADIASFAGTVNSPMSDFHSTLSFTLVKQFSDGYAFLSFGVGDCPIVLADKNFKWVKPLNTLDVGEYGGGTRFITMAEIFANDNLETRFNFEFTSAFPYLILMTDGIYDPKFEVEANLIKPEKWKAFFDDVAGNNNEETAVNLISTNQTISTELSTWMDFWSPGNHDDRTLIIVF